MKGRDIKHYQVDWKKLWLIATHNGYEGVDPININKYKAVKKHLDQFYPQLKKRQTKGHTPYNLMNCAFHSDFEKQKIIYSNMSKYLPFVYDSKNYFVNGKCYIITGNRIKYLTGFFNTKIARFWIRKHCAELQGGTRELNKFVFQNIPVPVVNNSKDIKKIEKLVELISQEKTKELDIEISLFFYKLYNFNEREIEFIEKEI